jgi:hypothetical protein
MINKTNAVIFTCSKHVEAARIAAKSASRFFNVVLAFDQKDEIPDVDYKVVKTTFNRNGNLNGFDCALGIAGVLMDHMDGDWVVKLDSDMVIHSTDAVSGCDVGGYVHPICPTALVGCYYGVSSAPLAYAIECIKKCKDWGVRNQAEDVLVTGFACEHKQSVVKRTSSKKMAVWHPTIAPNPKVAVANFGNHRVNGEWHRPEALRAMLEYSQRSIDTFQIKTPPITQ